MLRYRATGVSMFYDLFVWAEGLFGDLAYFDGPVGD